MMAASETTTGVRVFSSNGVKEFVLATENVWMDQRVEHLETVGARKHYRAQSFAIDRSVRRDNLRPEFSNYIVVGLRHLEAIPHAPAGRHE